MKLERISDNQFKFTIYEEDLAEYNLTIKEFLSGSKKSVNYFQTVIHTALSENDFSITNIPVLVEAVSGIDDADKTNVVILITKFNYNNTFQNQEPKNNINVKSNDIINIDIESQKYIFYSFNDIKAISIISNKISNLHIDVNSTLIKLNDNYIMSLDIQSLEIYDKLNLEYIFNEFGRKLSSHNLSMNFFAEHGKVIVKDDALKIIKEYY